MKHLKDKKIYIKRDISLTLMIILLNNEKRLYVFLIERQHHNYIKLKHLLSSNILLHLNNK